MQPFLTISETCVWAASRDYDAVAFVQFDRPDSAHWLMCDAPPGYGYSAHVMAWRCQLLAQAGAAPLLDPWEAYKQLPALCGDELLTMYGIALHEGSHEPIPSVAWAGLEISHNSALGCFYAAPPLAAGNPGAGWWTRLRLRSADVQRVWPPIDATLEDQPSTKRTAGAKMTKRDIAIAWARKEFPDGIIPPTMKNETLVADLRTATGIGMSEKTLRRALLAMGQNTDR